MIGIRTLVSIVGRGIDSRDVVGRGQGKCQVLKGLPPVFFAVTERSNFPEFWGKEDLGLDINGELDVASWVDSKRGGVESLGKQKSSGVTVLVTGKFKGAIRWNKGQDPLALKAVQSGREI